MTVGFTIFEPFLMASPAPRKCPAKLVTVPIRPSTIKTFPLIRLVISAPMLDARFTSFTLPLAVRTSIFARLQNTSRKNVPLPGP